MGQVIVQSQNLPVVLPSRKKRALAISIGSYRIERLSALHPQVSSASLQLRQHSIRSVTRLLEEVEQATKNRHLTPQKQRQIDDCIKQHMIEISTAMQRINQEIALILAEAASDLNDEDVLRFLYNFFKWYIKQ